MIERVEAPPRRPRRQQRRLTEEQVQELVALRRDGAEINALASRFGIHRATVLNHLRRHGEPYQPWPGRTLSPDQIQQAGQLYETGISLAIVGEQFDVDKRYLSRVLRKARFTIRKSGRHSPLNR